MDELPDGKGLLDPYASPDEVANGKGSLRNRGQLSTIKFEGVAFTASKKHKLLGYVVSVTGGRHVKAPEKLSDTK